MSGLESASIGFIAFGLVVVLFANISPRPAWRLAVLLVASLLFVGLLEHRLLALLPLAGFLLAGYLAILLVRRGLSKAVAASVILLIGSYAWLKQYSVLPASSFLTFPYFVLGLSYILFRVLHLVIDAAEPGPVRTIGPIRYIAYTLNLTTFISGPIQRYEDFEKQIDAPGVRPDTGEIGAQIERLVIGFFKVNVVALLLNTVHVDALVALARPGSEGEKIWALLRLVGCYPFFLYCNFSGYIDIVIALARLMGLKLPENFDRPFSAASFIDFWTRWHITLSNWLKHYVYNPLLISLVRRSSSAALEQLFGILCFFVTFFLVGVWHGRSSEFLVFGLLQGGGMALNKAWQVLLVRRMGRKPYRALAARPLYIVIARGLTFAWFAFSLIWFWANWAQIGAAFGDAGIMGWEMALGMLWLVASLLLAVWEAVRARALGLRGAQGPWLTHPYIRTIFVTVLAAIAFLVVAILSQPAPGIVYRTF